MTGHAEKDIRYHATIAHEYDAVITQPRAFANDLLFGALDPLIVPGARLLDLGCGTGQMLLRYAARFREATGVDHSPEMLEHACANLQRASLGNVRLLASDLCAFLAAGADAYDAVTCVGCLHHLPPDEIRRVIAGVARRLAAGGSFLFAEPIAVPLETLPPEIAAWNAQSVMRGRGYSAAAEDPDEGPLPLAQLHSALAAAGLAVVAESRGWELFPRHLPPDVADRLALWRMHHQYGANGNIYAAVAMRSPGSSQR